MYKVSGTIVTTGGRPSEQAIEQAKEIALACGYPFIERKKQSIARLQQRYDSHVLMAGSERLELYRIGAAEPFFFHPNSAMFRLKRVLQAGTDPLLEMTALKPGDSFLDCTLGLASDSILASHQVGENGLVCGLEGDKDIAYIVKTGLERYETNVVALKEAMQRIDVQSIDAISYLKAADSNSWDVVYIDPMFQAPIDESSNFTPLREIGVQDQLTKEWVEEAYRVCRKRVVVKDHFTSTIFKAFEFQQEIRPTSKFHFGYLEKNI